MAGAVPVIVALDWTPNTNHTGFFVAKDKGWYEQEGLDVKLLSPHVDGYKKTPASRVTDRTASKSETLIHTYQSALQLRTLGLVVAIVEECGSFRMFAIEQHLED